MLDAKFKEGLKKLTLRGIAELFAPIDDDSKFSCSDIGMWVYDAIGAKNSYSSKYNEEVHRRFDELCKEKPEAAGSHDRFYGCLHIGKMKGLY